jgi:hypothetical protein
MRMPGFNGEASLYRTGNKYYGRVAGMDAAAAAVIPAANLNRSMMCFPYASNIICIQQSIALADAVELSPFGPGD